MRQTKEHKKLYQNIHGLRALLHQKNLSLSRYRFVWFIYHTWLTVETIFRSIIPVLTATNYPFSTRIEIFRLECVFIVKAIYDTIFQRHYNQESFLGYTVKFPNYPEFVLLFTGIFGSQDYQLMIHKSRPTILDCGSNGGMSVLYFKFMFPNSKIIAVEANNHVISYLRENIYRNHLHNTKIVSVFISGTKGKRSFYTYQGSDGWSLSNTGAIDLRKYQDNIVKTLVDSIPLSHFLKPQVDVIKLDIEGVEGEALREAKNSLHSVSEIVMEYHPVDRDDQNSRAEIHNILTKSGFINISDNNLSVVNLSPGLKLIHAIRRT